MFVLKGWKLTTSIHWVHLDFKILLQYENPCLFLTKPKWYITFGFVIVWLWLIVDWWLLLLILVIIKNFQNLKTLSLKSSTFINSSFELFLDVRSSHQASFTAVSIYFPRGNRWRHLCLVRHWQMARKYMNVCWLYFPKVEC